MGKPVATPTAQAANTLILGLAAARAVSALGEAGIPAVLIKGPVLAAWLYRGQPRPYSDIDLVVDPSREHEALGALATLGYDDLFASPTERGASPHARTLEAPIGPATGAESSPGHGGAIALDLHRSFHGVGARPSEFWAAINEGAAEMTLFGVPIAIPGAAANTMLVALHAAAGGGGRRAAQDLGRALEQIDAPLWRQARELANRLEATKAFTIGLRTRAEGAWLADQLQLGPSDNVVRLQAEMPIVQGLTRLSGTRGFRARARLVARELFPSAVFMRRWSALARRGPIGLTLSYLLRPPLLLGQLVVAYRALRKARGND